MTSRRGRSTALQADARVAVVVGGMTATVAPRVLAPWLSDQASVDRLRWMAAVTGLDLIRLGTVAGQPELADPASARPLATALSILVGERLLGNAGPDRVMVAGHGAGELAAAVLADVLTPHAGLQLSVRIGQAEAAAIAESAGGQVALLGGYPPDIDRQVAKLRLSIAAFNGGGEIIVAGSGAALAELLRDPPRHARAERLPAIGAFSSERMAPVTADLRSLLPDLSLGTPRFPLFSGWDGRAVASGRPFLEGTANQLSGPIHWDLTMENLVASGVRVVIELPPAGAISSLVGRGMPGVVAVPLSTPEDLSVASNYLS